MTDGLYDMGGSLPPSFGGGASLTPYGGLEGRMGGSGYGPGMTNQSGVKYPSPFFDLATTYMPRSIKELFRWCGYYFKTHPLINAVVYKMAEYPITKVIIEDKNADQVKKWSEVVDNILQVRKVQIEMGLDHGTFGSGFLSVSFPFVKYIQCPNCGKKEGGYYVPVEEARPHYKWRSHKFYLSCPKCGHYGAAKTEDLYKKDIHETRLVRWSPQNIDVEYNHTTGKSKYFYKLPPSLIADVLIGKRSVIEEVPNVFIEAARKGKAVLFADGHLFHLKRGTIAEADMGWGMPMILPVLKDVFYLQILRKGQEAIAQEHIVPLRILFPQAGDASSSPYTNVNLGAWKERIEVELMKWRLDPNYVPVLPLPIGHEVIGGQGKALVLHQELRMQAEHIVAGMGVPQEFIFGGLQYCLDLDSYIQTSRGLLQLREIVPEEQLSLPWQGKVSTHKGTQDVLVSHNTGMKKAVVLRTRLGLDAAPSHDHRYRVLNSDLSLSWKRAHELKPGDRVAVRAGVNLWPDQEFSLKGEAATALRQWEEGRHRDTSKRYPCTLPATLTNELSRVLGYLVAEGTCTDPKRMSFGQEDPQVMGDFLDCIETCFGYRPNPTTSVGGTSVEIAREPVVTFLRLLGLTEDSYKKTVPSVVRRAPRQQVSEFLRAYFEGDGSAEDVEKKQTVSCSSVSATLLKEIQLLLLNMGVVSSRYDGQLQIRSEFVDAYAEHVGFVSDRKRDILSQRSPVGATSMAERIPYLKERLDAFREEHFDGRNSWTFEPVSGVELHDPTYTVAEVAQILDVDQSTVCYHARKGRLTLLIQAKTDDGRFRPRLILREDLRNFLDNYGRGVRRSVPGRDAWGMTYSKLSGQDLSLIREKEPKLAARIEELAELRYVWDEVRSVDLLDIEAPMGDLTIAVDSSYNADGLVCHNSGSNVSMRMLENHFTGYRNDQLIMVRDFIIKRVAAFMGWQRPESVLFEDFKMADDLQRLMIYFQMNQAQKISDSTLLRQLGENLEQQEELKQLEVKKQIESQKKMQIAQAEIMGQQQMIQLKYQQKAMQAGQPQMPPGLPAPAQETIPGQSGPNAPSPASAGTRGEQTAQSVPGMPQGSTMYQENMNQGPVNGIPVESQSPINLTDTPQGGVNILHAAKRSAAFLRNLDEGRRQQELSKMSMTNPQLHQLVLQLLNQDKGGQEHPLNPMQRPMPEQKPPRRSAGNALV